MPAPLWSAFLSGLAAFLLTPPSAATRAEGLLNRRLDEFQRPRRSGGDGRLHSLLTLLPASFGEEKRQAQRRTAVIDLASTLASELSAGRSPEQALAVAVAADRAAALHLPPLAARNVPEVLTAAALMPGAGGLAGLAVCWEVSARSGATMARAVHRVVDGLRADEDVRRELRTQLAGPRATSQVLALLPGVGLMLGAAFGANPLSVARGSVPASVCMLLGGLLNVIGFVWSRRQARRFSS